jgi:5-formyltetrahydrofolate cyclo-ligase
MNYLHGSRDIDRKRLIRRQAHAALQAQEHKPAISRLVVNRLLALPDYHNAQTVLFYVDVRAEVQTRHALADALQSAKRIVVPWCNGQGELELFHLESMSELDVGKYGILEPRPELRTSPAKSVGPQEPDFIMVPGVAFDRRGGRLGQGKGYYDKLLARVRTDAALVGLAFEFQMVDEVPMQPHDVFMHMVVTEAAVYNGIGRTSVVR